MDKTLHIPVTVEFDELKRHLRTGDGQQVHALLEVANPLISARALYKVSYIDEKLEYGVIIDGIRFNSRVLRKNLEQVQRVFPFVVTIGAGLEERAGACEDFLEKYYFDAIGNIALRKARKSLDDHLRKRFALTGLSYMSPGSLADWPIEEQRPLFAILKGSEASVGVRLSEHLLMIPKKSISGIFFPTEVPFYSCRLCPRQGCEGRRVPYNKDEAEMYGI